MAIQTDPRQVDQVVGEAAALAATPLLGELAACGVERIELDEAKLGIALDARTLLEAELPID